MHNFYKGSRSDEWQTPAPLWNKLHARYDFQWDLAASSTNSKCECFFSKEDDALKQDWPLKGTLWLNPPFSLATKFYEKCAAEAQKGASILSIYKATNLETKLWQNGIFPQAHWICFLNGRTHFWLKGKPIKGSSPTFGCALIGYNVPSRYVLNLGWVLGTDGKLVSMWEKAETKLAQIKEACRGQDDA